MTLPRLNIHIDSLVLRGFAPGYAAAFRSSLEAELTRSFGSDPDSINRTSLEMLDAGSVRLRSDISPAAAGRQVARQIVARLAR